MSSGGASGRLDRGSTNRLTPHDLPRFPGDTLFEALARVVCQAGCLPRKELYEAWEVARRVRRRIRGRRVMDFACGHGLLAHALLLLDDTSPEALAVDLSRPKSAGTLQAALEGAWPRLAGRVSFLEADLGTVPLGAGDLVVSSHACGALTDVVLDRAVAVGAAVAVLPCCHALKHAETGGLEGWMDGPLAVDALRAARLHLQGYRVLTQALPSEITPKNRLLLAWPEAQPVEPGPSSGIPPVGVP